MNTTLKHRPFPVYIPGPSPRWKRGHSVFVYDWSLLDNFYIPTLSEERNVFSFIHIVESEGRIEESTQHRAIEQDRIRRVQVIVCLGRLNIWITGLELLCGVAVTGLQCAAEELARDRRVVLVVEVDRVIGRQPANYTSSGYRSGRSGSARTSGQRAGSH